MLRVLECIVTVSFLSSTTTALTCFEYVGVCMCLFYKVWVF